MWTKHDNIEGADGVIGAEGWEYDVWHLEDTSGKLTLAIRTDSSDPTTQVEIFDVDGNEFGMVVSELTAIVCRLASSWSMSQR